MSVSIDHVDFGGGLGAVGEIVGGSNCTAGALISPYGDCAAANEARQGSRQTQAKTALRESPHENLIRMKHPMTISGILAEFVGSRGSQPSRAATQIDYAASLLEARMAPFSWIGYPVRFRRKPLDVPSAPHSRRYALRRRGGAGFVMEEILTFILMFVILSVSSHASKGLDAFNGTEFEAAVTMCCGDECPLVVAKQRVDWQIPDPKDLAPEKFREVRNLIEKKVKDLLTRL